jgi:MFS family permease
MTCLLATIFGFLFALPSSFPILCLLSAGIGLGVGGNIPIDATIVLEFLPKNRRYLLAALSTFQPIGTVTASLMAYELIPGRSCEVVEGCTKEGNMGWYVQT